MTQKIQHAFKENKYLLIVSFAILGITLILPLFIVFNAPSETVIKIETVSNIENAAILKRN